ncbi:MAG: hypothetical protein KDC35_11095 [Acidobacteria bacterium]|nr:hypothetical protein [Acidobacteriota bacterium]
MDFHKALEDSVSKFKSLEGIIFVDPDGEMIIYEAPNLGTFEVRLSGAKMPILLRGFEELDGAALPHYMELDCENRYFIHVRLDQQYSLTAMGRDRREKLLIRNHLKELARQFNKEIV